MSLRKDHFRDDLEHELMSIRHQQQIDILAAQDPTTPTTVAARRFYSAAPAFLASSVSNSGR